MDAKRCDLCGKYYINIIHMQSTDKSWIADEEVGTTIDLCPDCQRDFIEFLKLRIKERRDKHVDTNK